MTAGALLHARSRRLFSAGPGVIAIAFGAPPAAIGLAQLAGGTLGASGLNVILVSVTASVALAGQGLGAADPELETTTARTGPRLRLIHLTIAFLALAGVLVLGFSLLPHSVFGLPATDRSIYIVRDVAALLGPQALAAAFLGARLSWIPAAVWVLLLLPGNEVRPGWREALMTPTIANPHIWWATATATGLLLIGAGAHAARRVAR